MSCLTMRWFTYFSKACSPLNLLPLALSSFCVSLGSQKCEACYRELDSGSPKRVLPEIACQWFHKATWSQTCRAWNFSIWLLCCVSAVRASMSKAHEVTVMSQAMCLTIVGGGHLLWKTRVVGPTRHNCVCVCACVYTSTRGWPVLCTDFVIWWTVDSSISDCKWSRVLIRNTSFVN